MSSDAGCGHVSWHAFLFSGDVSQNVLQILASTDVRARAFFLLYDAPPRQLNTVIHDGDPLVPKADILMDGKDFKVSNPPKLVIVAVDTEKRMLKNSAETNVALRRLVSKTLWVLHPCGTVVFGVPRPWFLHGWRLYGEASHAQYSIVDGIGRWPCNVGIPTFCFY